METRQVLLSDQFCRGCHMPHSLKVVGDELLCEFCRNQRARAITRPGPHIIVRLRRWLANLIHPRQQHQSY